LSSKDDRTQENNIIEQRQSKTKFTAGKLMVMGRRAKGKTLKTFLAIGPAVSMLAPSAANLNWRNIVIDVITGNA
jgi:hypothetical protein